MNDKSTILVVKLAVIALPLVFEAGSAAAKAYKNRPKTPKVKRSKPARIDNANHIVITIPSK